VGVGVLALAVVHYVYSAQKKTDATEAAFWSMGGAACPTMDKATYDQAPGTPKVTAFQDIRFEYRVGHMMCTHRPAERGQGGGDHPVCQFTGPVLLGVKATGTQAYFAPAGMSAVRVAVVDGTARCVLIDHFEMKDHR
jgi:hypothetical protein